MHTQQLGVAARAAALATEQALERLAAPEDHYDAQIAGALAALERLDDTQALYALVATSAELAAALARRDHAHDRGALRPARGRQHRGRRRHAPSAAHSPPHERPALTV